MILRGAGAVFLGWTVVTAFVVLLSLYAVSPDAAPVIASQPQKSLTLKFPENEKTLDAIAAQLTRQGAALSTVEPAAGDKKPMPAK